MKELVIIGGFILSAWILKELIDYLFGMFEKEPQRVKAEGYIRPRKTYRIAFENPAYFSLASRFGSKDEVICFTGSSEEIKRALKERRIDAAVMNSDVCEESDGYDRIPVRSVPDTLVMNGAKIQMEPIDHTGHDLSLVCLASASHQMNERMKKVTMSGIF